jgi:hypothetical protein
MKKIIIGAFALAFAITSAARADVAITGFFQQIVGMGDDTTGGITHEFDRINFNASTTTDNGWEVGGALSHEPTFDRTAAPTTLHIYVNTDLGNVAIGHTMDAVSFTMGRVAAMVPGGGTDAGYQYLFYSGTKGDRGVRFGEAYYAFNSARVLYTPPSINGVNIKISYTPTQDNRTMASRGRTANGAGLNNHQETVEVAASYSGELEGIGYSVGIGSKNGNGIDNFGTLANDLQVLTGSIKLTQGAWTLGYHIYDNGSSFGKSDDSTKASSHGYNVALTHSMGNIVIGVGYSEMEAVDGSAWNTAAAGSNADGAQSTNITNIGISYNLGGGVGTYVQMSDYDISDGKADTTEISPQVIFAGISLGF